MCIRDRSKRYRKAAIRLLEKSLQFQFPEKKAEEKSGILSELQELADDDAAKKAELEKHIKEMEALGYDMEAYKHPDDIGGATAEEVEAAKKEALLSDRTVKKGMDLVENIQEDVPDDMPDCDRNCKLCYRKHCKYRKES